ANIEYIWPELFIYYDDLYFSYRLSQQGYRFRYSPELVFLHDVVIFPVEVARCRYFLAPHGGAL
uniref:glycosyltransferase family 2 protein n=1 Tax=Serratia sp. ME43 TaxID=2744256 RepID=UPI00351B5BDF